MPKQDKSNLVMNSTHGNLADQVVFRQVHGNTIIGKVPIKSTKKRTAAQLAAMEKFKAARLYARGAMLIPELRTAYEAKVTVGKTAFRLAYSDYFDVPEVLGLTLTEYTGSMGQPILVHLAGGDIIKYIRLSIFGADGNLLERGTPAITEGQASYSYTATADNPVLTGTLIKVEVSDYAGNETSSDIILP